MTLTIGGTLSARNSAPRQFAGRFGHYARYYRTERLGDSLMSLGRQMHVVLEPECPPLAGRMRLKVGKHVMQAASGALRQLPKAGLIVGRVAVALDVRPHRDRNQQDRNRALRHPGFQ